MTDSPRITRVRPADEPAAFKIGDRVRLRADAEVLDFVRQDIGDNAGVIVEPDGMRDWVVFFDGAGPRWMCDAARHYAFDEDHLVYVGGGA